jgi:hypothetical protein
MNAPAPLIAAPAVGVVRPDGYRQERGQRICPQGSLLSYREFTELLAAVIVMRRRLSRLGQSLRLTDCFARSISKSCPTTAEGKSPAESAPGASGKAADNAADNTAENTAGNSAPPAAALNVL